MMMHTKLSGTFALAALLLAGCATQSLQSLPPEEQVLERAQARWDAARTGDFEKSYSFTAPSYRAVTDIKIFRNETAGSQSLISAKVISVTCATDSSCAAKIRIEFYSPLSAHRLKPDTIVTHYDEQWTKEDSNWWLFRQ